MTSWNVTRKPSSDDAINFTSPAIDKKVLELHPKNHVTQHFHGKKMEDIDTFVSSCVLFIMISFVLLSIICIFRKKKLKNYWNGGYSVRQFHTPSGLNALTTTQVHNCTPYPHGFAQIHLHGNCQASYVLIPQSKQLFLSDGFNMPPTDLSNIIENSSSLEKPCDICGEDPPPYEVIQRSTK